MDPDETWRRILALAKKLDDGQEKPKDSDSLELAELVLALDEWVTRGGFPPNVFLRKK